jgi:CIC family chloride channel protein
VTENEVRRKLNPVLLWAAVAGLLTGLVGSVFRLSVSAVFRYREQLIQSLKQTPFQSVSLSIALSAVMVFFGFSLMRRFAPEIAGSGIPQIEGALEGRLPLRWRRVLPIKFLAGILVLGSGMVMGREGPTIQMGGNIGKMVGDWFRASEEQVKVLVAASGGAGLATAFNAPLAGILFVYEEIRPNFKDRVNAYRSVTIASVMATIVMRFLLGQQPTLAINVFQSPPLESLWIFVLLGVFFGAIGYGFNFLLIQTLNAFARLQGLSSLLSGFFLGGFIGFMSWLYATTTGGGEEIVVWLFRNQESGGVLLLLFAIRFGMTVLCYGSGAPGGIFAPMLSIATLFSLGLTRQVSHWFPFLLPEPDVLPIAGMGALVAATVRAPLTAIVLTIEITANYWLILPLLITCLAAAMTAHRLGGEPIYSILLQRQLSHKIRLQ